MSIEIDLGIKHHFTPDLYAKEMHLPKDHFAVTHKHTYDHISMLYKGSVVVTIDGEESTYTAPSFVLIKAHQEHKIYALDDVVWFCVHETSETDVEKIDEVAIES
jgi:quercetin dioxygenase-like cupin family protein